MHCICNLHPLFTKQIYLSSWKYTLFKIMSLSLSFSKHDWLMALFPVHTWNSADKVHVFIAAIQGKRKSKYTQDMLPWKLSLQNKVQRKLQLQFVWSKTESLGIFPSTVNNISSAQHCGIIINKHFTKYVLSPPSRWCHHFQGWFSLTTENKCHIDNSKIRCT